MLYFVVAFYLLTGPIADLATAMILNRKFSQSNSASSTLSNVWVLYSDKELLHEAYQKEHFRIQTTKVLTIQCGVNII